MLNFVNIIEKDQFNDDTIEKAEEHEPENLLTMLFTITIPFFIAGFGMVGAGILLDIVQVCLSLNYFANLLIINLMLIEK